MFRSCRAFYANNTTWWWWLWSSWNVKSFPPRLPPPILHRSLFCLPPPQKKSVSRLWGELASWDWWTPWLFVDRFTWGGRASKIHLDWTRSYSSSPTFMFEVCVLPRSYSVWTKDLIPYLVCAHSSTKVFPILSLSNHHTIGICHGVTKQTCVEENFKPSHLWPSWAVPLGSVLLKILQCSCERIHWATLVRVCVCVSVCLCVCLSSSFFFFFFFYCCCCWGGGGSDLRLETETYREEDCWSFVPFALALLAFHNWLCFRLVHPVKMRRQSFHHCTRQQMNGAIILTLCSFERKREMKFQGEGTLNSEDYWKGRNKVQSGPRYLDTWRQVNASEKQYVSKAILYPWKTPLLVTVELCYLQHQVREEDLPDWQGKQNYNEEINVSSVEYCLSACSKRPKSVVVINDPMQTGKIREYLNATSFLFWYGNVSRVIKCDR